MSLVWEKITRAIEKRWYSHPGLLYLLFPLELLYACAAKIRKAKQKAFSQDVHFAMPIVVVGNISVGGTGKTPTIVTIVQHLQSQGKKVGVVSRGYGRRNTECLLVADNSAPEDVGDEPYLIFRRTQCAVAVAENRLDALTLLQGQGCDVVLADDGMQHYRMPRDIEVLLLDGTRGFGNGHLLPLGPLRESIDRCDSVDFVLVNGESQHVSFAFLSENIREKIIHIEVKPTGVAPLTSGELQALESLDRNREWFAVVGIGNPQRFFTTLDQLQLKYEPKVFNDHHWFCEQDFEDKVSRPVIMTEKDAVKCQSFAKSDWYQLAVSMQIPLQWLNALDSRIDYIIAERKNVLVNRG